MSLSHQQEQQDSIPTQVLSPQRLLEIVANNVLTPEEQAVQDKMIRSINRQLISKFRDLDARDCQTLFSANDTSRTTAEWILSNILAHYTNLGWKCNVDHSPTGVRYITFQRPQPETEPNRQVHRDLLSPGTCPICYHSTLHRVLEHCPKCNTPHHQDCWEYNGNRCAIYGCEKTDSTRPQPEQPDNQANILAQLATLSTLITQTPPTQIGVLGKVDHQALAQVMFPGGWARLWKEPPTPCPRPGDHKPFEVGDFVQVYFIINDLKHIAYHLNCSDTKILPIDCLTPLTGNNSLQEPPPDSIWGASFADRWCRWRDNTAANRFTSPVQDRYYAPGDLVRIVNIGRTENRGYALDPVHFRPLTLKETREYLYPAFVSDPIF